MNSTYNKRRENLRAMVEQWGGPLPIARKMGYSNASFVVQMCGPNPTREVTEKTARKIETALGIPTGWLDEDPGSHQQPTSVDLQLVSSIVKAVGTAADEARIALSPAKFGDVVALVYADAQEHKGIREEYITAILKLTL